MNEALNALAERVEAATASDNALDVIVEIALFKPGGAFAAIRANSAGTKVICTRHDGSEAAFRADDWTMRGNRAATARALRECALASQSPAANGEEG